jgi:hypothetical protein
MAVNCGKPGFGFVRCGFSAVNSLCIFTRCKIIPVSEDDITPLLQLEPIELFVQVQNDLMRKIRKKLGIEKKITTYVARHTFSTVLKRSGVST